MHYGKSRPRLDTIIRFIPPLRTIQSKAGTVGVSSAELMGHSISSRVRRKVSPTSLGPAIEAPSLGCGGGPEIAAQTAILFEAQLTIDTLA